MIGSTWIFSTGLLVLAATGSIVACQGSDLTLPSDALSFNLRIVSGDGQRGTVGSELDSALVVGVTDVAGQPVTDLSLRFEPTAPGAEVEREEVRTNQDGEAETRVRLGDTEGTQTVEVRLAEVESALKASFTLTAVANEPPQNDDDDEGGDGGRGRGRGNGGGNGGGGDEKEDDDD
jgi:hypothetical protein